PPSVREIGDAVGLKSTSTVHGHLTRLEKKGLLFRDSMKPRAIEVLDDDFSYHRQSNTPVPLVGKVTAGLPILATENIEEYVSLPNIMVGEGTYFVLSVKGESMMNAGIIDGDYVIVHKQSHAENGDIVVAMMEDEATIKRFFKEEGRFRLQPENDFMEPIIVSELTILGKIVSLYRLF
ncbi:MAG: transcriptional repressor LexA, partial [Clostridiales bacterium]|nr:transcriptional repressor LexA [Clostridiales bacterium]